MVDGSLALDEPSVDSVYVAALNPTGWFFAELNAFVMFETSSVYSPVYNGAYLFAISIILFPKFSITAVFYFLFNNGSNKLFNVIWERHVATVICSMGPYLTSILYKHYMRVHYLAVSFVLFKLCFLFVM